MGLTQTLDAALRAVCPIEGVSVGRNDDKATWRIAFAEDATADQKKAAQALIDAFDIEKTEAVAAIDAQLEEIDDATREAMRGLREILLGTLAWATAARTKYPDLPEIPMNQGIVNLAALEQAAAQMRLQRKAITG